MNYYCLKNWIVTVWPLLRFLTISGVIELHFKRVWSRWKSKTWGYKLYEGRITEFCPQDSQNCSSTNIGLLLSNCYCKKNWIITFWTLFSILSITKATELGFMHGLFLWNSITWVTTFMKTSISNFVILRSKS